MASHSSSWDITGEVEVNTIYSDIVMQFTMGIETLTLTLTRLDWNVLNTVTIKGEQNLS